MIHPTIEGRHLNGTQYLNIELTDRKHNSFRIRIKFLTNGSIEMSVNDRISLCRINDTFD